MKDIAYYNGKIGRIDEVQAPITDRGFYFGDGVYDAAMVNNKKIFELEDHLDRFYNSLKLLRIEPPMQRDELTKTLNELVSQLDSDAPHMLYWQSTRAVAHRMHAFPKGGKASLMAFFRAVRTGPSGSSVQADLGGGHPFPALQHQDAEPDSKCHRLPALHRTGLPGNGLPPRRTRHRMRPQQYLNHQGRRSPHPTER